MAEQQDWLPAVRAYNTYMAIQRGETPSEQSVAEKPPVLGAELFPQVERIMPTSLFGQLTIAREYAGNLVKAVLQANKSRLHAVLQDSSTPPEKIQALEVTIPELERLQQDVDGAFEDKEIQPLRVAYAIDLVISPLLSHQDPNTESSVTPIADFYQAVSSQYDDAFYAATRVVKYARNILAEKESGVREPQEDTEWVARIQGKSLSFGNSAQVLERTNQIALEAGIIKAGEELSVGTVDKLTERLQAAGAIVHLDDPKYLRYVETFVANGLAERGEPTPGASLPRRSNTPTAPTIDGPAEQAPVGKSEAQVERERFLQSTIQNLLTEELYVVRQVLDNPTRLLTIAPAARQAWGVSETELREAVDALHRDVTVEITVAIPGNPNPPTIYDLLNYFFSQVDVSTLNLYPLEPLAPNSLLSTQHDAMLLVLKPMFDALIDRARDDMNTVHQLRSQFDEFDLRSKDARVRLDALQRIVAESETHRKSHAPEAKSEKQPLSVAFTGLQAAARHAIVNAKATDPTKIAAIAHNGETAEQYLTRLENDAEPKPEAVKLLQWVVANYTELLPGRQLPSLPELPKNATFLMTNEAVFGTVQEVMGEFVEEYGNMQHEDRPLGPEAHKRLGDALKQYIQYVRNDEGELIKENPPKPDTELMDRLLEDLRLSRAADFDRLRAVVGENGAETQPEKQPRLQGAVRDGKGGWAIYAQRGIESSQLKPQQVMHGHSHLQEAARSVLTASGNEKQGLKDDVDPKPEGVNLARLVDDNFSLLFPGYIKPTIPTFAEGTRFQDRNEAIMAALQPMLEMFAVQYRGITGTIGEGAHAAMTEARIAYIEEGETQVPSDIEIVRRVLQDLSLTYAVEFDSLDAIVEANKILETEEAPEKPMSTEDVSKALANALIWGLLVRNRTLRLKQTGANVEIIDFNNAQVALDDLSLPTLEYYYVSTVSTILTKPHMTIGNSSLKAAEQLFGWRGLQYKDYQEPTGLFRATFDRDPETNTLRGITLTQKQAVQPSQPASDANSKDESTGDRNSDITILDFHPQPAPEPQYVFTSLGTTRRQLHRDYADRQDALFWLKDASGAYARESLSDPDDEPKELQYA